MSDERVSSTSLATFTCRSVKGGDEFWEVWEGCNSLIFGLQGDTGPSGRYRKWKQRRVK